MEDSISSDDSNDELNDNISVSNDDETPHKYLRNLLDSEDFNNSVEVNSVLSKFEILMGILKLGDKYSLPNSAVADICKLINPLTTKTVDFRLTFRG